MRLMMVQPDLREIVKESQGLHLDIFDAFLDALAVEFGEQPEYVPGRAHGHRHALTAHPDLQRSLEAKRVDPELGPDTPQLRVTDPRQLVGHVGEALGDQELAVPPGEPQGGGRNLGRGRGRSESGLAVGFPRRQPGQQGGGLVHRLHRVDVEVSGRHRLDDRRRSGDRRRHVRVGRHETSDEDQGHPKAQKTKRVTTIASIRRCGA